MKTDRRHVPGRIRAKLRDQAARALEALNPHFLAADYMTGQSERTVEQYERDLALAKREHARLVRQLRHGLAIGPLKSKATKGARHG